MEKSVGIDVSKDMLDVSVYDGNEHNEYHYDTNDIKAFRQIIKDISCSRDKCLITMESTGVYSMQLASYLHSHGYTVSVLNPLIIKRYAQMKMVRAKTDRVDARVIAEYGYSQQSCIFKPKSKKSEEIFICLKVIRGLYSSKTQIVNRLRALSRRDNFNKIVIKSLKKIVKDIDTEIMKIEDKVDELISNYYSEERELIMSIPGVGPRVSAGIIGLFERFELFENSKQVISYIGTNPSPRQ